MSIFEKLFGTYSEKEIKKIKSITDSVMNLEGEYEKLTDIELKKKTDEFKERVNNGESLEDILPEAFATVRETAWRVLGLKPYEVQIIGGIILHQGRIAEMKTGEGKTLVSTLPAYLNALTGEGVFIVTVNEYLAKRDSEQMGKIYNFLGLTTGVIINSMNSIERQQQYKSDVVYSTNNEIGFDHLKDNMVMNMAHKVQRGFHYAIVDEVDSILIDEARTPLIISGEGDDVSDGYTRADEFIRSIKGVIVEREVGVSKIESMLSKDNTDIERYKDYDYTIDEKDRTVALTERGIEKAEKRYGVDNLGDIENIEINHYITRALKAHALYKKDIDYVVSDDEIVIIDEHTGRLMDGRRYSEGIHQAIETKEKVKVKNESKTLATISFQNLFRKFEKLGGMTGTAMTESDEFRHTYNLDVVEVPTNRPIARDDKVDKVYLKKAGKMQGIINTVKECSDKGQPILVGTASVESSEELSDLFKKHGIKHKILNAKQHENEAKIVAQAGEYGSVTIATNMAGRGTDIMLGGNVDFKTKEALKELGYNDELIEESNTHTVIDNADVKEIREKYKEIYTEINERTKPWAEKVKSVGGLYILGTERHSSRRIDNQLRGRAGRQGDPGVSEFLVSLEDDLMRLFGADRMNALISNMSLPEDVPLDMKIIANTIEGAQKRIEGMHFSSRKSLMEYDDVINIQREIVYKQRDKFLENENIVDDMTTLIKTFIEDSVNASIVNPKKLTLEDQDTILTNFSEVPNLYSLPRYSEDELLDITPEKIIEEIELEVEEKIEFFIEHTDSDDAGKYLKRILLFLIDSAWQDHLVAMDDLREGIGLRAYGQQDPVEAYKNEGFDMFEQMLDFVRKEMFVAFMKNHESLVARVEENISQAV